MNTGQLIAEVIVMTVGAYMLAGLIFGLAFVTRGIQRIDPAAKGTGWSFRLIILPGAAAFWPLLLRRWVTHAPAPEEDNAHRRAAKGVNP